MIIYAEIPLEESEIIPPGKNLDDRCELVLSRLCNLLHSRANELIDKHKRVYGVTKEFPTYTQNPKAYKVTWGWEEVPEMHRPHEHGVSWMETKMTRYRSVSVKVNVIVPLQQ
jgi:hypothetical protein